MKDLEKSGPDCTVLADVANQNSNLIESDLLVQGLCDMCVNCVLVTLLGFDILLFQVQGNLNSANIQSR